MLSISLQDISRLDLEHWRGEGANWLCISYGLPRTPDEQTAYENTWTEIKGDRS